MARLVLATRYKGGPGSGFHGHSGRPGKVGGSAAGASGRVWTGEAHPKAPKESRLSRLKTGEIGEALAMRALEDAYGASFTTLNEGINNAPIDVAGDHRAVEVKAGLASNGPTAQYWRATVGQLGKNERSLVDAMTPDEKKTYYKWKNAQVLKRKNDMLAQMSKEAGAEIKPMTVGVILAPDGSRADVYAFPGFHLRMAWKQYATDEYHIGTYSTEEFKGAPGEAEVTLIRMDD